MYFLYVLDAKLSDLKNPENMTTLFALEILTYK